MTAREIFVEQGSNEWLQLRCGFVTPSRFRTVVNGRPAGVNSYLKELRAGAPKNPNLSTPALSWGKYHEPEARAQYQLIHLAGNMERVRAAGFFVRCDLPRVGGSPDALVVDWCDELLGGVEFKCPYNPLVHEKTLRYGMPDDHKFQVQGYMWLLNLEWWDFVSYDPRAELPKRIFVQRILRDWTFSDRIDQRVRWFHDLLVSGGSVEEGASIEDALLNGAMKPPKFF